MVLALRAARLLAQDSRSFGRPLVRDSRLVGSHLLQQETCPLHLCQLPQHRSLQLRLPHHRSEYSLIHCPHHIVRITEVPCLMVVSTTCQTKLMRKNAHSQISKKIVGRGFMVRHHCKRRFSDLQDYGKEEDGTLKPC